jgi:4-amino-4-deoxy-L-arabinose transferase-like glycosyltransferase
MTAGPSVALDARDPTYAFREPRSWAGELRLSRPWIIVIALTLAGLGFRLLLVRSLWVDEAISVHQAHMSLGAMLENLRQTDNHPPLYFICLWATVRVFGFSQLAVHLPSIVAGTALVPALFVTGRELFGRRTGLVAAALGAIAPLAVWYSQEARMYSLFMLFATLVVWAQLRAIRDGRVRFWAAYAALTIGLVYTHWFSVLPIAVQQLAFSAVIWRRMRKGESVKGLLVGIGLTWLAVLLAVFPLAGYAVTQFKHDQTAGTGFAPVPTAATAPTGISVYALLTNFVWAIWGYHADSTMLRVAAMWPLLMLVALGVLGRRRSNEALLLLVLASVPVLALLVVGLKKRDLFEVRYFAGAVPMLLLLCARGLSTIAMRKRTAILATVAVIVSLGVGLVDEQLNGSNPRTYDFRGAIRTIESLARPGDTVLYEPDYLHDVLEYYAPGLRAAPLDTRPVIRGHGGVFLIASFLDQPGFAGKVGTAKYDLARTRRLVSTNTREKIYVWEYR